MSANDNWRWMDDEGVQRLLSGDELRKALADGRLSPDVIVWRRGMTNWKAASSVPELNATAPKPGAAPKPRPASKPGAASKPRPALGIAKLNLVKAPAAKVAARKRANAPDGGWASGAASRDRPEDTVTNIRPGDAAPTAPKKKKPNRWTRSLSKSRAEARPGSSGAASGSQPPPPPKRSQAPKPSPRKRGFLPSAAPIRPRSQPPAAPAPAPRAPDARGAPPDAIPTRKRNDRDQPAPSPTAKAARGAEPLSALTASSQLPSQRPRVPTAALPSQADIAAPEAPAPAGHIEVSGTDPSTSFDALSASIPKAPKLPQLVPATIGVSEVPQSHVPTVVPPPLWQRTGVTLPIPLLIGAAVGLLLLLLLAFAGGRASATAQGGMADALRARNGWLSLPLYTRQQVTRGTPRVCLMARAPARIARPAYQRVPMELLPLGHARVAIGYAATPKRASGVTYDLMSAKTKVVFSPEEGDDALARVVPVLKDGGVTFITSLREENGLRDAVVVPASPPYRLAFRDNSLVFRASDSDAPKSVWSVDTSSKPADSIRTVAAGEGTAVTFRNGREIYAGELAKNGGSRVTATKIWSTDGTLGRPSVGYNGRTVAVTFADLPRGAKGAKLMLAHATAGEALPQASEVELPSGGPGVSAIAPAIAGLSGGRWLLMWTEGPRRRRTLRAQTYDRNYRPVGAALRVSPATGSFGQGTVTVVQERVIVGFLLATGGAFELWSTVLQCQ